MTTNQSSTELRNHLNEQLRFLYTSSIAYDQGNYSEAKRMAVSARVLLHDTSRSHSLLTQMNLKSQNYRDTRLAREDPDLEDSGFYLGLISSQFGGNNYVPNLADFGSGDTQTFDDWWNSLVIKDFKENTFTRRSIILTLANQDGGAHVDPTVRGDYADLTRNNSLQGQLVLADGTAQPIGMAVHATMRQITHELLVTLVRGYLVPSRRSNIFSIRVAPPDS